VHSADLTGPTAVLFGNEARGLSAEALTFADTMVRVPIRGRAESLNLASAATLVLFEAARQRSAGGADLLADVVGGAAHDIRSPLTALRGFASTLLSRWDRLDEEQRLMMLEGIVHDSARMEVVVAQLVDGARLRSGQLQLAPVPTDLLEAAHRVAGELGGWGAVDVEVAGEPARAMADPARLRSILIALVEGAHWWGEHGPVRLETASSPPAVRVYRDGSTIGAGEADAVLRPRAPGSGGATKVGLFVASGLAQAHGGTLEVWANDSFGFLLTLPPESSAGTTPH
jgi:K+-sensing histidine kinase KdpD